MFLGGTMIMVLTSLSIVVAAIRISSSWVPNRKLICDTQD
jgi:hypothetical protein